VTRMQTSVRYYITESDDRAVVRSVPVAKVQPVPVDEAPVNAPPRTEATETRDSALGGTRVTRLVRAAARRADLTR
jgi:hypothetical protein